MRRHRTFVLAIGAATAAAAGSQGQVVSYRLLPGSMMTIERCLPPCKCAAPPITLPLVGTFDLGPSARPDPIYDVYDLTNVQWRTAVTPMFFESYTGAGDYRIGGDPAFLNRLLLQLATGPGEPIVLTLDSGFVVPSGAFPAIDIVVTTGSVECTRRTMRLVAAPIPACVADCTADGRLDITDFVCYQNKFALGDPAADCTGEGVLDVSDFVCFQNQFALGCR